MISQIDYEKTQMGLSFFFETDVSKSKLIIESATPILEIIHKNRKKQIKSIQ